MINVQVDEVQGQDGKSAVFQVRVQLARRGVDHDKGDGMAPSAIDIFHDFYCLIEAETIEDENAVMEYPFGYSITSGVEVN